MSGRRFAVVALFSALSAPLAAQDLGVQGDPNRGSLLRPDAVVVGLLRPTFSGADAPDAGARTGFSVGVRSKRRLNRRSRLETGVGIASRGARESSGSFSATTTTLNLEVPVSVRFSINELAMNPANQPSSRPRMLFNAIGGIMGDFNLSCNTTFESSGSSSSSECTDNAAFDVAAVLGGGAIFQLAGRPVGVDVLFTNGFVAVFKDFKVFNRSLGLNLTFPMSASPLHF